MALSMLKKSPVFLSFLFRGCAAKGRFFLPLLALSFILVVLTSTFSSSGEMEVVAREKRIMIDNFSTPTVSGDIPVGWKRLEIFKNPIETDYSVEEIGGRSMLKAHSRASVSAIYRDIDFDLRDYPIIRWEWKISNIIENGDATIKAGDDYAARIYLIFSVEPEERSWLDRLERKILELRYGLRGDHLPSKAINYIWANKLSEGEVIANPYTSRSMMLAVKSGPERAGQWQSEERNVYEDYKRIFNEDPIRFTMLAVMTDTDDTGGEVTAFYDNIYFTNVRTEGVESQ